MWTEITHDWRGHPLNISTYGIQLGIGQLNFI